MAILEDVEVEDDGISLGESEDSSGVYDDDVLDKKEFGIVQCLPVEGIDEEPDFDSEAPLTVEEYLRRVRYEAKNLPQVMRSDAVVAPKSSQQEENYSLSEDASSCDDSRKPSVIWMRAFLAHFVGLRRMMAEYKSAEGGGGECMSDADMPYIKELLPLKQVALQRLLEKEVMVYSKKGCIDDDDLRKLYTVTALLELPCNADTLASLQRVMRMCAAARAEKDCPSKQRLALLNLIIVICGGLFRQDRELAVVWDEEMYAS